MARPTTVKKIQLHTECKCGLNSVGPTTELIAYRDFKYLGIKRKKCKKSGQPFLSMKENYESCYNCNPERY